MSGPVSQQQGQTVLSVRVTPKASQNAVTGLYTAADGHVSLSIKVTAAPDKGKANKAVIEVLSDELGFAKTAFVLIRGETDRNKLLAFSGSGNALVERIAVLVKELEK